MARYTSANAKSHERVKLEGFRGIDTSSSQIDVDKFRATEMRNIISRNGQNRKRHGWKQELLNIDKGTAITITYPNSFGGAVQGIYGFKFAGETETRVMVYANKKFWLKNGGTDYFVDITPSSLKTLKDRPCQFYLVGDILYIIGMGDFLAYNGYTFSRVSESAYVPTTVINIVSKEYAAENTAAISRERLDDINLLTPYVKNELIGNKNGETFELDHAFTDVSAEVYVKATGVLEKTLSMSKRVYDKVVATTSISTCFVKVEKHEEKKAIKVNATYDSVKENGMSLLTLSQGKFGNTIDIWLLTYNGEAEIQVGNTTIAKGYTDAEDGGFYVYLTDEWASKVNDDNYLDLGVGGIVSTSPSYIDVYYLKSESGLYDEAEAQWADIDLRNRRVKFTKDISAYNIVLTLKTNTDYSKRITDCSISTMFGVNGHSDRLFVAGNKNRYNDWEASHVVQWSQIDDFTYFPETSYTKLGTQATAINGMQRLNDDSLCLFKEASTTEPTIYVMYGEYNTDKDGNTTNVFRTYAGNVAEGLIAPNSTGNLAGDILMLSSNGVYGVELSENVVSTAKYTKERGLPIKRLIKEHTKEELKKAYAIVRDDRYILCIANKCYVAESRYSYKPKGSPRDTFSYEWYVWDNIPALCFSEIDGELYFGTADGRLCRFDNSFTDRLIDDFGAVTVAYTQSGGAEGTITTDKQLKKGDVVGLYNETLYGYFGKNLNIIFDKENQTFTAMATEMFLHEGDEFFTLDPHVKYIVNAINIEDNIVIQGQYIPKIEGSKIDNGEQRIFYSLHNKPLVVTNHDKLPDREANQFTVSYNNEEIIWFAGNTGRTTMGYFLTTINVVSEWYSNVMDFGVPDYSKTLLGFTVVPEKVEGDSVAFGYVTREVDNQHDVDMIRKNLHQVTDSPLNFDNLAFFPLAFNSFQNSYTKKVKVRNFNYLMWFYRSDSPTDSAIDNVVFEYKINHKNKGVN